MRVLTASRNRGKGGAVRLGMFSARGAKLLFADADGATTFRDIERLEKKLEEKKNCGGAGGTVRNFGRNSFPTLLLTLALVNSATFFSRQMSSPK